MQNILLPLVIGLAIFAVSYLLFSSTNNLPTTASIASVLSKLPSATTTISTISPTQPATTPTINQPQTTQQTTATTTEQIIGETTTTTTTSTANLCKGNAICAYDTVTEVIDGDTLNTQQHGTVRLALVNTPEKGQDGYDEAKEFLTDICFVETSSVLIDQDDRQPLDNFGRIVAKVFCGELNANEEIYYGAYGEINTDYCGQSEFASEDWAIDGGC